jgi:hypothetical protein
MSIYISSLLESKHVYDRAFLLCIKDGSLAFAFLTVLRVAEHDVQHRRTTSGRAKA